MGPILIGKIWLGSPEVYPALSQGCAEFGLRCAREYPAMSGSPDFDSTPDLGGQGLAIGEGRQCQAASLLPALI
jgi:hypothetical protein